MDDASRLVRREAPRRRSVFSLGWLAALATIAFVAGASLIPHFASAGTGAGLNNGWGRSRLTDVPGGLRAVAAAGPHDVWALGGTGFGGSPAVALHWDGAGWSAVRTNVADARLNALAVVDGTDIWAVGSHGEAPSRSLIEHWNGTRWLFVPSPVDDVSTQELFGVYAATGNDVWAVGYRGRRPLIEHWNGSAWRTLRAPSPANGGGLTAIAGSSSTDIWAVGFRGEAGWSPSFGTLVEHWNGRHWKIVPSPGSDGPWSLNAVAVRTPSDVWAVGGLPPDPAFGPDAPAIRVHWNGRQWRRTSSATTKRPETLYGLTFDAHQRLWAVGQGSCDCAVAEYWNGSRWIDRSPGQIGDYAGLLGVGASLHRVWAVGFAVSNQRGRPLVLHRLIP